MDIKQDVADLLRGHGFEVREKSEFAPEEMVYGSIDCAASLIETLLNDDDHKAKVESLEARIKELTQGEPVAWFTEDHLTDKSATTWDSAVADRWRHKGWQVWNLYTRPGSSN